MPRSPPVPPKHDDQTNRQPPKRDRFAALDKKWGYQSLWSTAIRISGLMSASLDTSTNCEHFCCQALLELRCWLLAPRSAGTKSRACIKKDNLTPTRLLCAHTPQIWAKRRDDKPLVLITGWAGRRPENCPSNFVA